MNLKLIALICVCIFLFIEKSGLDETNLKKINLY
jgi:hypothetical protein